MTNEQILSVIGATVVMIRSKPIYINIDEREHEVGWAYNQNRRHLILYSTDVSDVAAGVAAHILSKSAYLGRGYIHSIPEHLKERAWPLREWVMNSLSHQQTEKEAT